METKKCSKCGKILPVTDFNWRDKAKGTRRADCKYCHSQYMKDAYAKKQKEIQDLKAKFKCAKCGDDRGYVLDFHHINPSEKDVEVSRMISNNYKLDKVYDEIKKCICLCANCHREFHYLEKEKQITLEEYLA